MMKVAMDDTVRNPTAFLERLLELEWPGRVTCVTPAPFDPVEAAPVDDPRSFEVLDVTVGPHPEDPAFAFFRLIVAEPLRRGDWPGLASLVLTRAREKLDDFRHARKDKGAHS